MNIYDELKWRGLIKDVTDEEAYIERLEKPLTLYCGFDPTADSMHIGNLQQILLLKRYQMYGHTPIALIGDATGMIGDPRPTTERKLMQIEDVRANGLIIKEQLERFLSKEGPNAVIVANNYDWLSQIDILSFLRDYGKHFSVSYMLNKDVVANRLSSGISFTEFTYTILQSIDFLHLYETYKCECQIGGSDQWGNLTSGTELIRKIKGDVKVFGVTSPLIANSDGSKFGKSEGKNIWLDINKTSAYAFFQYWMNVADADVIDLMRRLSFKSPGAIQSLELLVLHQPHLREAQRALASELTIMVHGQAAFTDALRISEVLFNGQWADLSLNEILEALEDAPSYSSSSDILLIDALVKGLIATSNREARELIQKGSISVNGVKVNSIEAMLNQTEALYKSVDVIKKGKKTYLVVKFTETL
ncbi:MAG: tyrosine--tRNA ligase [Erysipelotrichaceae bacterium]